jgi:chromosome segregation ATPase
LLGHGKLWVSSTVTIDCSSISIIVGCAAEQIRLEMNQQTALLGEEVSRLQSRVMQLEYELRLSNTDRTELTAENDRLRVTIQDLREQLDRQDTVLEQRLHRISALKARVKQTDELVQSLWTQLESVKLQQVRAKSGAMSIHLCRLARAMVIVKIQL